jgi:hypothetical protein
MPKVAIAPVVLGLLFLSILLQWIGTTPFPRGAEHTLYSNVADYFGI